jgi:DpnII restriction endonuclease
MGDSGGSIKVVIEKRILRGSDDSPSSHKIATVYVDRNEYRVYAPAKASGNALDWLAQFIVRQPSPVGFGAEMPVDASSGTYVIKLVQEELEKHDAKSVGSFYHVRFHILNDANIEVKFDLARAELEKRILEPYKNLRPIVIGGRTIPVQDLERVEIYESTRPSYEWSPMITVLARRAAHDWFHGELNISDVTDGFIVTPSFAVLPQKTDAIELLCLRFHVVAKQLRQRRGNRPTIDVADEYDVQDLFHALLRVFFDDVRKEEGTPSFAGKSSRMDFLLPSEQLVIEAKRSRPSLGATELGSELIDDIARYKQHPSCKKLVCFVYDPEGYVVNPRGIEGDLSRTEGGLEVTVVIAPRD